MSVTLAEESSLDRYLESQAGLMLSHASMRRGVVIMTAVGTLMLLMALVICVAALVTGHDAAMAGAIGPTIAGSVNLIVSRVLKRRINPALEVNANLTPEARGFMANLMKDVYGWPQAWGAVEPHPVWNAENGYMSRHQRIRERHVWRHMLASGSWGKRQQSAKQCLNPAAFDMLDKAAYQYNRIAGILGTGHPEVARFAPTIKSAADQAMADVFHVGYLLDSFPESQSSAQAKADQEIASLTELAERMESMQRQPAVGSEAVVRTSSPISNLLEELKLDQSARAELSKPAEEGKQQQININSH
jgi:hypothetical protein